MNDYNPNLGSYMPSSFNRTWWSKDGSMWFEDNYTQVEGPDGNMHWVRKEYVSKLDFQKFFYDLSRENGSSDFSLGLTFAYNNVWVYGLDKTSGYRSSFGGLNMLNFLSYEVATVYSFETSIEVWDLNGDGLFQKNEADNWWINGKGKGVEVDNSKIDWTGLKIPKGRTKGDIFSINTTKAFLVLPYTTAATYGGTSFKVIGNSQVMVLDQLYHYQDRPKNSIENRIRNFMTRVGKPSGQGTDFMIYYSEPTIQIK